MMKTSPLQPLKFHKIRVLLLVMIWGIVLGFAIALIDRAFGITSKSGWVAGVPGGILGGGFVFGLATFKRLVSKGRLRWFVVN
jgi:hypothetical protein